MKTCELYALHLHGEDITALGATDIQKLLIKLFEAYPNTLQLQRDIKKLNTVRERHLAGIEFCGDITLKRIDAYQIKSLSASIEAGESATEAACKAGMSNQSASVYLRAIGYEFNNRLNRWNKKNDL